MIDCKSLAQQIKEELKPLVTEDKQLAIIQVGENPASNLYVKHKIKDCEELGIYYNYYQFPETTTNGEVLSKINELNAKEKIKGIIIQLPLPEHLNTELLTNAIADDKDIDGFKVTSKYIPCTPKGVMSILDSLDIELDGKTAVIVGKGKTVGRPLINLLLDRGVTVTVCHSKTKPLTLTRALYAADIIITAVGKANLIKEYMIDEENKDLVIIDVGISRDENGKQVGDCEKKLHDIVDKITGYTQSVGLMTRTMLLENLLKG